MKTKPLIFLLFVVAAVYSCNRINNEGIKVITALEMQDHIKYDNLQVVDVQPADDYNKSHLLNARNIIYDKDFRKKLDSLDKDRPVAIYCTSGKVSPEAARILKEAGFQNIYVLEGGIKKWEKEKR